MFDSNRNASPNALYIGSGTDRMEVNLSSKLADEFAHRGNVGAYCTGTWTMPFKPPPESNDVLWVVRAHENGSPPKPK